MPQYNPPNPYAPRPVPGPIENFKDDLKELLKKHNVTLSISTHSIYPKTIVATFKSRFRMQDLAY